MICWICNKNEANSGEHKFKSSLLKDMYGKRFADQIIFKSESNERPIQGPNSYIIKFPKVICEYCNNNHTSKHDRAFHKLITWSTINFSKLRENLHIDFEEIFGDNWIQEKKYLLKYLAKHAGCKIVTGQHNYDVENLSKLIYNDIETNTFQIKFILKEGFKVYDLAIKGLGGKGIPYTSNSPTVCSIKNNKIVYFGGLTTYNWLSIAWVHTQSSVKTNSPNFTNKKEKLILYPFDELPEVAIDGDWVSLIDNQRMETDRKQIEFYDTFI